jgi:hypothetical protein
VSVAMNAAVINKIEVVGGFDPEDEGIDEYAGSVEYSVVEPGRLNGPSPPTPVSPSATQSVPNEGQAQRPPVRKAVG